MAWALLVMCWKRWRVWCDADDTCLSQKFSSVQTSVSVVYSISARWRPS